jgi:hypothetical protein
MVHESNQTPFSGSSLHTNSINQTSPANTSSDPAMHKVTPAHQLLPPNGLRKVKSIGLPLIEIQIDNATPEFQQLFKPSSYSGKDFNTNRRPFLKCQRKLQQNHRPPWDI